MRWSDSSTATGEEGHVNSKAGSRAWSIPTGNEQGALRPSQDSAPHLAHAVKHLHSSLSPKERAVALAAARGAEDKEIASELACTLSTVRTLWQRIYKKTHTNSKRRLISSIWNEACQHCLSSPMSFIERHDERRRSVQTPIHQGGEDNTLLEDST
jgi:DNA-binding CsgD family transcriptional regulator